MPPFPLYTQLDAMDCGPTCLRMIVKHYGKIYSLHTLRKRCEYSRTGVSMLGISQAAESIGFRTMGVLMTFQEFSEVPLPAIVHWNQNHFVVVYKISGGAKKRIFVADPRGRRSIFTEEEFSRCWLSTRRDESERGAVLLLEPTPEFYSAEGEKVDRNSFLFLYAYVRPYKQLFVQLFLGLLLGSCLQLIFPFLTQNVVDFGIGTQNISFIWLVLFAQLALTLGNVSVDFLRGWILLHLGTRINISLISDFLAKLMKLPLGYFDTKMTGDLMQRIGDHGRINSFLTGSALSILFSIFNLVLYSIILLFYNIPIFLVFFLASAIHIAYITVFLKYRRELDHKSFAQHAANQSNVIQLITGMQEIKLNSCERKKRWEWERIQARLFKVSIRSMALGQYQSAGSTLITQAKNILVTVLAAQAVIEGQMTMGMMLSVQYIIGQLNGPIGQILGFVQQTQDAKISLERLSEIHDRPDEEDPDKFLINDIPPGLSLQLNQLSFKYEGAGLDLVLEDLDLHIPAGKITAIVGASGSGKTTIIKLLLGFYPLNKGSILLGNKDMNQYSISAWRKRCGVVMQEGFIFSDTVAQNVAPGEDDIDVERLYYAVNMANIREYIESLPLGYNTKIGQEGTGLSQGQKQRILIARAIYKNPEFIFFDEATNALDANNEKQILDHLNDFFKGRTVVVVAHRLSTVKNADNIVVLDKGKILEQGTHRDLSQKQGAYYELVKNQLELGNG